MAGDVADAGPFIAAAKGDDAAGINIMAELTLGQIAIKNGSSTLITHCSILPDFIFQAIYGKRSISSNKQLSG